MTEEQLIQKIQSLRGIQPRGEFANHSRRLILSSPRAVPVPVRMYHFLSQSLNIGLSIVLSSLIIVVFFGGVLGFLRPTPSFEGITDGTLTAEADNVINDIDIRLNEVQYFETAARKSIVALKEASTNGPAGHINPLLLEREIEYFEGFEDPTNQTIDDILNKVSL